MPAFLCAFFAHHCSNLSVPLIVLCPRVLISLRSNDFFRERVAIAFRPSFSCAREFRWRVSFAFTSGGAPKYAYSGLNWPISQKNPQKFASIFRSIGTPACSTSEQAVFFFLCPFLPDVIRLFLPVSVVPDVIRLSFSASPLLFNLYAFYLPFFVYLYSSTRLVYG